MKTDPFTITDDWLSISGFNFYKKGDSLTWTSRKGDTLYRNTWDGGKSLIVEKIDSCRPSCLHCVEKHLAAAAVTLNETDRGYPHHRILVIGHLHEAEDESADELPELAAEIRRIRIAYSEDGVHPDFREFYDLLQRYGRYDSADAAQSKISKVMREFRKGELNIGKSEKKVRSRKQAVAIALSEAKRTDGDGYHLKLHPQHDITARITHPKGSMRHGKPMKCHYGLVLGTYGQGGDGQSIDVYVGDAPSNQVWRITQNHPTGEYDEDKFMCHFSGRRDAMLAYIRQVGRDRFGGISAASWEDLRPKKLDTKVDADDLFDPWAVPEDTEAVELPTEEEISDSWHSYMPAEYGGIIEAQDADDQSLSKGIAAAVLLGAWLFSRKRNEYLKPANAEGQRDRVSEDTVADILDTRIAAARKRFDRLSTDYERGAIGVDEWWDQVLPEVLSIHSEAYVLGKGGLGQLTRDDRDRLEKLLRFHRFKLSEFHQDLMTRGLSDLAIRNRLRMYAQSARSSFEAGQDAAAKVAGYKTEQWFLGNAEHCPDCVALADMGRVKIGTLPPIGSNQCVWNCKCTKKRFKD